MDATLVNLIHSAYGTITDEDEYAGLPALLADYVGSTSGWILIREGESTRVAASHNLEVDHLTSYEQYFGKIDPFTDRMIRMSTKTAVSFERLVPTRDYIRTEFYNDYIRPNRLSRDVIGAYYAVGDSLVATTFHRTAANPFDDKDEARLQAIVPHLQRAFDSRAALVASSSLFQLSETLFQSAADAVLLCDPTQRVLHLNRAARRLPVACASIGREGRLAFRSSVAQSAFVAAVDQAARRRIATIFQIVRQDRLAYQIEVSGADTASPTVVVTILDLERQLQRRIEHAQHVYLFTPSECALAESLMRGRTPEEHAAIRGTALSTVRSQLHIMFAKSKTHRQSELIVALTQSA